MKDTPENNVTKLPAEPMTETELAELTRKSDRRADRMESDFKKSRWIGDVCMIAITLVAIFVLARLLKLTKENPGQ